MNNFVVGKDCIGVGVGALIFNKDNKILLALRGEKSKNEVGKWEIPGGAVEFGETMEQAIKREIKEELDIEIEIVKMLDIYDHIIPEDKQHWIAPNYICKIIGGKPKIMEPRKCDKIGWFSLKEISKLPLTIISQYCLDTFRNNSS